MLTRITLATTLAVSTVAAAQTAPSAPSHPGANPGAKKLVPDDLPGPPPEVARDNTKVDPPPVPVFDLPVAEPGFHGPRELRVHSRSLLGTEIKVKGYITWIYDCATALAVTNPNRTRAQIVAAIDNDASLCERPKFYLGDARTTPRDASMWVVEVPRPSSKVERQRLPRDELKAWPAVPKLALGDYVIVTGIWGVTSPHGDRNTDGLLVYKQLEHTQPAAAPAGTVPASPPSEPDITVATRPPMRAAIDPNTRDASLKRLDTCNKQITQQQYDAGITECQAAIKLWDGNHRAWYAWSSAHMHKSEWQKATTAVERAVALRPDDAMYQLYHGIAMYEAEHERVRDDQARKENKRPEEVVIDPTALKLDAARDALRRAIKLDPQLWRGHFYLGRIYRELGDDRRAAEQFTATIATHPLYRYGYVALIELYRRWDYDDQALAVARLGTATVPAADVGELWLELGMAYNAKHDDDKAIEAFGKAIELRPDDLSAKFQRGQIYFRRGDQPNARRDLEEVAKSTDPRMASARPLAHQMLGQIGKRR